VPSTNEGRPRTGGRTRVALILLALAALGWLVAFYLVVTKLSGGLPVCGPVEGCDVVATSPYSVVFGIPVALYGLGFSSLLVVLLAGWWRRGDRRWLWAAYALGLVGSVTVAYLTYLELFVIGAICIWCVTYGATVVAGWVAVAILLARRGW
jgi:uncharacterized membrane protein